MLRNWAISPAKQHLESHLFQCTFNVVYLMWSVGESRFIVRVF